MTIEMEDRVLELDSITTPGPWLSRGYGVSIKASHENYKVLPVSRSNHDCIAYTRTAAPKLTRECRRLREEVNALQLEILKHGREAIEHAKTVLRMGELEIDARKMAKAISYEYELEPGTAEKYLDEFGEKKE